MNESDRNIIAKVCDRQHRDSYETECSMPLFLRRVSDEEIQHRDGAVMAPWEIDMPSLGITVYGELPEVAFEEAMRELAQDGKEDVDIVAARLTDEERDEDAGEDLKTKRISGSALVHAKSVTRMIARAIDDAEKRGYERGRLEAKKA